jgi:shikimate 5-dehydrogenase
MARALAAGCRVSGGYSMLQYQGYEQFLLFTGEEYETTKSK